MFQSPDFLKTWVPILVSILALFAGTGWLQYYLNKRSQKRERYRSLIEEFLIPLENILRTTSKIFTKLRDERELANFEYHPGRLQEFFGSLPDEDPRKQLWKSHIEWLQEENCRAVELVERFSGRMFLPEFRDACNEFLVHAKEWEIMWKALMDSDVVIPASLDTSGMLYAPRFPKSLENALQAEIMEVKKHARTS